MAGEAYAIGIVIPLVWVLTAPCSWAPEGLATSLSIADMNHYHITLIFYNTDDTTKFS